MASPVVHLPDAQLRPLLAAYDASVRARRWNSMLVVICVVVAVALSSVSAEVDLGKLIANIGNFTSYIYRLFHLESGALGLDRSGRMVLGPGALAAAARPRPC